MVMLAAMAAGVIAAGVGHLLSEEDRNRARKLIEEAYQEIERVGAPPDLARQLILEKFQVAGMYVPEMEQAIDIGMSKVAQIQEDPTLRDAQTTALKQLQDRGKLGITAEERAEMNKVRDQAGRDFESRRKAITSGMAARGQAGSGADLASQLSAGQATANMEAQSSDEIAAMASRRALESIKSAGSLGGQIRQQDFDVNRTRAEAEDEFKRFDVTNQISRQQRNIAAKNSASLYNIQNKQRVQDMNTQQTNDELRRQRKAEGDVWNMRMESAKAKSNAKLGKASAYNNDAQNTRETVGAIGSAVGQGVAQWYQMDQNNQLMDMKRDDLQMKRDSMLDKKYKNDPYGWMNESGYGDWEY